MIRPVTSAQLPPLDRGIGADPDAVRRRLIPAGLEIDPITGAAEAPLFLSPSVCAGLTVLEAWSPLWGSPRETGWLLLGFSHSSYRVELDEGWRFVSPGEVIFINPRTIRVQDATPRCLMRGDYLWFPEASIHAALADAGTRPDKRTAQPFPRYNVPLDPETFLLQRRLFRYLLESAAPDPLYVEDAALAILERCVRLLATRPERGARPVTARSHDLVVECAKAFVAENLTQNLRVSDVGRAVGVSPTHLGQLFRVRTGKSIHEFVTDLRVLAAFDRLGDYRGDYTRLGLALGFCSGQHFSNTFRTRFGAAPRRLLQRLRCGGNGAFADWLREGQGPAFPDRPFVIADDL